MPRVPPKKKKTKPAASGSTAAWGPARWYRDGLSGSRTRSTPTGRRPPCWTSPFIPDHSRQIDADQSCRHPVGRTFQAHACHDDHRAVLSRLPGCPAMARPGTLSPGGERGAGAATARPRTGQRRYPGTATPPPAAAERGPLRSRPRSPSGPPGTAVTQLWVIRPPRLRRGSGAAASCEGVSACGPGLPPHRSVREAAGVLAGRGSYHTDQWRPARLIATRAGRRAGPPPHVGSPAAAPRAGGPGCRS